MIFRFLIYFFIIHELVVKHKICEASENVTERCILCALCTNKNIAGKTEACSDLSEYFPGRNDNWGGDISNKTLKHDCYPHGKLQEVVVNTDYKPHVSILPPKRTCYFYISYFNYSEGKFVTDDKMFAERRRNTVSQQNKWKVDAHPFNAFSFSILPFNKTGNYTQCIRKILYLYVDNTLFNSIISLHYLYNIHAA